MSALVSRRLGPSVTQTDTRMNLSLASCKRRHKLTSIGVHGSDQRVILLHLVKPPTILLTIEYIFCEQRLKFSGLTFRDFCLQSGGLVVPLLWLFCWLTVRTYSSL